MALVPISNMPTSIERYPDLSVPKTMPEESSKGQPAALELPGTALLRITLDQESRPAFSSPARAP
jgi:hypothetical protein